MIRNLSGVILLGVSLLFATSFGYGIAKYGNPPVLTELYQKNIEGTFIITDSEMNSLGTAWLVDENLFVTAAHVINSEKKYKISGNDNRSKFWNVKVEKVDPERELALFSLEKWDDFKIKESPQILKLNQHGQRGQDIWGIGNRQGAMFSFFSGHIAESSIINPKSKYANSFKMDMPVVPGDSGGPIFNSKGEAIGLTSAVLGLGAFEDGQIVATVGLIISADTIQYFIDSFRLNQKQFVFDLGETEMDFDEENGIVISKVDGDFANKELELRVGDHDLVMSNQWSRDMSNKPYRIQKSEDLLVFLNMTRPGETITILLKREDGTNFFKEVKIPLDESTKKD